MAIQPQTKHSYLNEDQRWIAPGGISALRDADSIVLDVTAFTVTSGRIPSGTPLAKLASGLYGPYSNDTNEAQTLTVTGTPTGGTYTLTFSGQTTGTIPFNATAAQVKAALEALSNIDVGDVTVTGGAHPGTPIVVTFGGQYLGVNVAQMTASSAGLTGGSSPTVTPTTSTAGGADQVATGLQTGLGFLVSTVTVDSGQTADELAALLWHGEVDETFLPVPIDAGFRADTAAKFRYV